MTLSALSCSDFIFLRSLFFCWSCESSSLSCLTSWAFIAWSSLAFLSAASATSLRFCFSSSICLAISCSFFSFYWSRRARSLWASSTAFFFFFSYSNWRSYSWYFRRAYSSTPTDFLFSCSSSNLSASSSSSSMAIPPYSSLVFLWRLLVSLFIVSSKYNPFLLSSARSRRTSLSSSSACLSLAFYNRSASNWLSNLLLASALSRLISTVLAFCCTLLSLSLSYSFSLPESPS